jgi:sulfite oxidase
MNPAGLGKLIHSASPFNAEPALKRLMADMHTAQSDFYVRNHGNVPVIDEALHRITVSGRVDHPVSLSLDDLKRRFDRVTICAVMQCAGNRRSDLLSVKPVSGDPWAPGAIGNAAWTGARLKDVLESAGIERDNALHVGFASCDDCEAEGKHFRYGVSIPASKALSGDVLLAYEMNGEALSPEHGHPLRVVVPGYAGVRSPKWLASIEVRDTPSDNHMQQREYKLFPASVDETSAEWDKGTTINEMPLNSAICEPDHGAMVRAGPARIAGYAVAMGTSVARVEVSSDDGRTWRQADLTVEPCSPWSWTLWSVQLTLPKGTHELSVRAWDSAGQTQVSRVADVWNFKGYLSTAWHRITVVAQ